MFGTGVLVRSYREGQWARVTAQVMDGLPDMDFISQTFQVTANHKGFFEFRLCDQTEPSTPVTEECFQR